MSAMFENWPAVSALCMRWAAAPSWVVDRWPTNQTATTNATAVTDSAASFFEMVQLMAEAGTDQTSSATWTMPRSSSFSTMMSLVKGFIT